MRYCNCYTSSFSLVQTGHNIVLLRLKLVTWCIGLRTAGAPKSLSEGTGGVSSAVTSAGVVGVTELVVGRREVEQRRYN